MKKRLDVYLAETGAFESRETAKSHIMSGAVFIDGLRADKPGLQVNEDTAVEVRGVMPYVSRGGLKLEKAVAEFGIDLRGSVAADIGASTGGFTDCMLQSGAEKVYAVDVGYGQLAWKLRENSKVVNLERINARFLSREHIPETLDFFSVDVSFISLKTVLPPVFALSKADASAVCLIKPQFEAGKGRVGKNGVVREKSLHVDIIRSLLSFFMDNGAGALNLTFSPVKGPKGNIEFLAYVKRGARPALIDVEDIVERAHAELSSC